MPVNETAFDTPYDEWLEFKVNAEQAYDVHGKHLKPRKAHHGRNFKSSRELYAVAIVLGIAVLYVIHGRR